jgi:hypothetical protein
MREIYGLQGKRSPQLGVLPVAQIPVPTQIKPSTVYFVVGASIVVVGASVLFWYLRKGRQSAK